MNNIELSSSRRPFLSSSFIAALAFVLLLLIPETLLAQWTTNGSNINNTNTGNVGIGTTNPTAKLDVNGLNEPATTASAANGGFILGALPNTNLVLTGGVNAGTSIYSWFQTRHRTAAIYYNLVLQPNGGNVGIGTTAPGYRLDVQGGTVNTSGGFCIAGDCRTSWAQVAGGGGSTQWTTSGTSIYYNSGNIGVGTVSPNSAKLVIGGTSGTEGLDLSTSDQYANLRVIRNSNSSLDRDLFLQFQAGLGSRIHLYSNNAESMTVAGGNVGIGTTNPGARLDVNGDTNVTGNLNVTGNINAKYQDVAEWVPSLQQLDAGTVVVLDRERANHVLASTSAYDTRVAGVISAAPGVLLGQGGAGKVMVATTGRVRVRVDARRAPVHIGDLLVTSDVAGVAMKSEPLKIGGRELHAPGTIIGKALESLESGSGEILVLLSLQ